MTLTTSRFEVHRGRVGPLRVAVAPIAGLRSVVALIAVEAGQWAEPAGRPGVARLTALSLLRGTLTRDAAQWAAALDDIGAIARMDVGAQVAVMSGQALAEDLPEYLRIAADAILRPSFPADELAKVRAETLAALEEESRNTRGVAERAWREIAYPAGHPFRSRPLGEPDVVRTSTVEDLRDLHSREILGSGGILVLAGAIAPEAGIAAAEEAFGTWTPSGEAAPRVVPDVSIARTVRRAEVVPDKTQSDVIIGWLGLPRTDPRFVAARVTNMVFAADTFASRAGRVVRDELGLAYYFFSTLSATRGQGPWTVRMGVNPRNVERAIETTLSELGVVLANGFPQEDLDLAQDKLVGELTIALESPAGIAQLVLEEQLFDLGADHYDRYAEQIRSVTKDEVVETARRYLPADRYALALAGPPLAV